MKNYIYSDEEDFSEEEEEEEIEIKNQGKHKKNKKKLVNQKKSFDEDFFDMKVAISIRKSHRKKDAFSEWVNLNITHLEKLYKLSSLSCKESDFYYYIYQNTKIN